MATEVVGLPPTGRRRRICAGFVGIFLGWFKGKKHHGFWKIVSNSCLEKKKPEISTYTSIGSFPQISSPSPFVSALYHLLWVPPIWVMLPDTAEKILFLFASSVYLCPNLATLLHYCMWERGNGLINRLKKKGNFSESLQQYFFKNLLMWCKKKPIELWIIDFL